MEEKTIVQAPFTPPPPPPPSPVESGNGGPFAKIDAVIAKTVGILDGHPWEKWVAAANGFIGKWLPFVVAVAGVVGFLTGFITAVRADFPFGAVVANFGVLAAALVSMHLTPKALSLPRAFLEKREPDPMRPELLYILKTNVCFGALITAVILILRFDGGAFATALAALAVGALLTIVFGTPSLIGVKAVHPQNAIEEVLCIVLLPVKLALSLLTPVVGVGTVALFITGVSKLFDKFYGGFAALPFFWAAILAPVAVPVAVYLAYLVVTFTLDLYRAIVAVPRKLDDVRKAIEDKR